MIEVILLYLFIGFVSAAVLVAALFNKMKEPKCVTHDDYIVAGIVGIFITVFWVIAIPIVLFASIAWYVTESKKP
jgi:hypothetical protein